MLLAYFHLFIKLKSIFTAGTRLWCQIEISGIFASHTILSIVKWLVLWAFNTFHCSLVVVLKIFALFAQTCHTVPYVRIQATYAPFLATQIWLILWAGTFLTLRLVKCVVRAFYAYFILWVPKIGLLAFNTVLIFCKQRLVDWTFTYHFFSVQFKTFRTKDALLGLWIEEFSFLATYAICPVPERRLRWTCITLLGIWVKKWIEIALDTVFGLFVPVRQVFTSYTHLIRWKIRLIFGTQALHILLIKSSSTWTIETFIFGHIKIRVIGTNYASLSSPNRVINWTIFT